MKGYLTRNTKMLKISGAVTWNWGIPAFRAHDGLVTCPKAANCAAGCFARAGFYRQPRIQRIYEARLALARSPMFVPVLSQELARRKVRRLRIHDSGDFYSDRYLEDWCQIMRSFAHVAFYTYTKRVSMFKAAAAEGLLPQNFSYVFSFGGLEDDRIDVTRDRHCRVFESHEELDAAGYVDATEDDAIAAEGHALRLGLCYHGKRLWENTRWPRVAQPERRASA